jgi:DeoR family transcriptional regulator, aga operon transcriptional repressor
MQNAEPLPTALRRRQMLETVKARSFMRVTELGEMFGISTVTVRSDLEALARDGQIQRIRGGAIPLLAPRTEQAFEATSAVLADEKAAIGRAAAALVANGETVLLDVGTTTTAVAVALVGRIDLEHVTVVTNGLNIALELERAPPRITVVVTGGTLRPLQHSLVNPLAEELLAGLNADTAFLGCNGVHPEHGITNVNLPESEVKRRMLRMAARRIVVADGSKLGRLTVAKLCDVGDVDLLITGESAPSDAVTALEDAGLTVHVAG